MSDPQFFQTKMGRQFYDGTMPRIAQALEDLVQELKQQRQALDLLHDHDTAWDNEEESVKDEHADLIRRTRVFLTEAGKRGLK